eukprot:129893-Chlamydomonas_euryale.AAC.5
MRRQERGGGSRGGQHEPMTVSQRGVAAGAIAAAAGGQPRPLACTAFGRAAPVLPFSPPPSLARCLAASVRHLSRWRAALAASASPPALVPRESGGR